MEVKNVSVKELKPYVRNAKKHTQEQIDNVAESIRQFGWVQPIVVDKDNCIVIGHCRYEASKKLGYDEVPVVRVDELTDEQIRKLRLLDNKLNESEWDEKLLELELLDLDLSDFSLFDDDEDDSTQVKDSKKRFEAMQLKAFEHYDYVVFVFDNTQDFLNVCSQFNIKKVEAGYGKAKKIGIGRVLRGEELLKRIGY